MEKKLTKYFISHMQPEGIPMEARKLLLERASQGTSTFVMNK
jgi:hypothetical protein